MHTAIIRATGQTDMPPAAVTLAHYILGAARRCRWEGESQPAGHFGTVALTALQA